jgi:DNA-binding NtrC family response regulator
MDDIPERSWVLSKILNSEGYGANPLAYSRNGADRIEKESPDLLIPNSDLSEAGTLGIFPKIREIKSSLAIFIRCNSVARQFRDGATNVGISVSFPKVEVTNVRKEVKRDGS